MIVKKAVDINGNEITSQSLFMNRRSFVRSAVLAASTAATALVYRRFTASSGKGRAGEKLDLAAPADSATAKPGETGTPGARTVEPQTPYDDITHYNNYYEFSTDKRAVAEKAKDFITRPWTVSVEGLVNNPKTFDLDDFAKLSPLEERVYRHRCVEGWSMVIPWAGFPLSRLLDAVQPNSQAKYVQFETIFDPKQLPNERNKNILDWPYVEGLRLDEALHPLTILATGLYGETLPPQNGAPLRLVVPWKYGFKGIKSIVKIRLVAEQPPTTWNIANAHEYGFYSNVNPHVDHPRWSQAREQRIGESSKRDTLIFNGYAEQVAGLYNGMDLKVYF